MKVLLYSYQKEAIKALRSGSILCGGVGTGKSITSLAYYYTKQCNGVIRENGDLVPPSIAKKLYIITTARKRDTGEWISECDRFGIKDVIIDSWNNLRKYVECANSFFIFDEQRVVGSGSWTNWFLTVSKKNSWILLSATPGDTWLDYVPVFLANGLYKNKTEFLRRHVIFDRFAKYPKVNRYIDTGILEKYRDDLLVDMKTSRKVNYIRETLKSNYDDSLMKLITESRWNPFDGEPIQDIGSACYLMRKVVNSDISKLDLVKRIIKKHPRVIIFYNFDYELTNLRQLSEIATVREWNGHKHESIPESSSWIYLVQYMAGAEGWNCTSTNTIIFYSMNYSYKLMTQAAGRIDRMNTPFKDLYYYTIKSNSQIDKAIDKSLKSKGNFNERAFLKDYKFA